MYTGAAIAWGPTVSPRLIQFDDFELDLDSYELRRCGNALTLQKIPMELLILLVEKRGHLLARKEIIDRLWGKDVFVDTEHSINTAVCKIRLVLNDNPDDPRFIQTITGKGYRFIAPTKVLLPSTTGGDLAKTLGRLDMGHDAGIQSLGVLPFVNLSGDPAQEYFSDGMTEAVIAELSKIRSLKVISRTSAMQYKGVKKALPQVARELAVEGIIEGSVLREGSEVRVSVQLIHGVTDQHLWTESYQREMRSILRLQRDMARAIAEEIRINVTAAERARLAGARHVDPEAHELYLKGRYCWNRRTPEALKNGLAYFQQAIEKDRHYAQAYAGLADSYALLGVWEYRVLAPREAFPKAKAAATKAIELDNSLAEAHSSLALSLVAFDWDWSAAEREFKRAIELNPGYATAHQWYGSYLSQMGRHDEAIAEMRQAERLDPLSLIIGADVADALFTARLYDRSIEQSQKIIEMDDNFGVAHFELGQAYMQKELYDEAIAELQRASELSRGNPAFMCSLAHAYAVTGRRNKAVKMLRELEHRSKQTYLNPAEIALIYLGLGEKDQALLLLQKAYEERFDPVILTWPAFDPVRSDPRFHELFSRLCPPG
jgi:TolB-like protein/DNA-binding winged helix-turn-helix (wHTH) protein/tetratricopeptide (TPR) repeat protein